MGYRVNINQSKQKVYEKAVATKILDLIDKLRESNNKNNPRRWIWELLQNAKDVKSHKRGSVDVTVDFRPSDAILAFKHNGRCFSSDNITFLIEQVSTKERSEENLEDTTGKFGTGFLTTHLLSEVVEVKGVVKDDELPYRKFCILLDRSGTEIKEITASVNKSLEQLDQLEYAEDYEDYEESEFNTIFTYNLNQDGLETAIAGINDLKNCLPLTLVFLPSISSVKIENESRIFHVISSEALVVTANDLTFSVVKVEEYSSEQDNTFEFIKVEGSRCEIAIPINRKNGLISLTDTKKDIVPRIFCDFPLVGSEKFGIPFFINSPHLHPTEPRDGISLTDKRNDKIKSNKQIIETAVSYYLKLVDYAVSQNWKNLYQLADISIPANTDWLSKKWYDDNILILVQEKIYTADLVRAEDGSQAALKEGDSLVNIPFDPCEKVREAIWDLVNEVSFFRLSAKEDIHQWYKIFKNKIWDREHCLDVSTLSRRIAQDNKNLEDLSRKFGIEEPIKWLNQYFDVLQLAKEDSFTFLKDGGYSIIPNQYGEFCPPNELLNDSDIENALKDVGKNLFRDYYEILAHKSITFSKLPRNKTQESVISEINNALQLERISQKKKRLACYSLTRLFPADEFSGTETRIIIYSVSVKFFGEEIPSKLVISNWNPEIWEVSDRMQSEFIVKGIADFNYLNRLSNHLSEEIDKTREWLSAFVSLLVRLEWTDLLREKTPILPNQNGAFCDLNDLFMEGESIDESLKDIAAALRRDFRDELIDNSFNVPIPKNRKVFQKNVGSEIRDLVSPRLSELTRTRETQEIFNKLILWMDDNPDIAETIFGDLHENRHKLYDDAEVARNLRKVSELEQENHSLKSENEELKNEIDKLKSQVLNQADQLSNVQENEEVSLEDKKEIDDDFLVSYGVTTQEKLEEILSDPGISRKYFYSSASDYFSRLEYVLEIIARAKQNVRAYLESLDDYDCSNWRERGETYIEGVLKRGEPIKIIVRPSDNRKIIFYYPEEKQVLSGRNSELWVEDGETLPRQITLGVVLTIQGIDCIDLPESF